MRLEKRHLSPSTRRLEQNFEPIQLSPGERGELDALCNAVYNYLLNADTLFAQLMQAATLGIEKLAYRDLNTSLGSIGASSANAEMRRCARWLDRYGLNLVASLKQQIIVGLSSPQHYTRELRGLENLEAEDLDVSVARAKFVSKVMDKAEVAVEDIEAKLTSLNRYKNNLSPQGLTPSRVADAILRTLKEAGQPASFQALVIQACSNEGMQQIVTLYEDLHKILLNKTTEPTPEESSKKENLWSTIAPSLKSLREQLDEQADISRWQPGMLGEWVKKQYAQQVNNGAPELEPAFLDQVNQVEANLIDTLKDEKISPRIRKLIVHLILPLVVIRSGNPDDFDNPNNPARAFIRQLIMLGYKDNEIPIQDFDVMQVMVSRIEAEKGHLMDAFHVGAQALYTIAHREVNRQLARATKAGGSEKVSDQPVMSLPEEARHRVIVELRELMANLKTPPEARLFVLHLLGPWMMVRFQRYGEDSQPWAEARAFAALFFDAIRPATTDAAQIRKQAVRRQTIHQARIRAERSNSPPQESRQLIAWLRNYLPELDKAYAQGHRATEAEHAFSTAFLEALPVITLTKK